MKAIDNFRKQGKAYPGDTYLEDCARAAKSKSSWSGVLVVGAALAAMVDLYNIHDLFAKTSDASSADAFTWLVAIGIVAVYVFVGFAVGNPLRSWRAYGERSDFAIAALAGAAELAIVAAVAYFRYGAEAAIAANKDYVTSMSAASAGTSQIGSLPTTVSADPLAMTLLYTFIMVAGALMSIVYAYKHRNALAERAFDESSSLLMRDRAIYDQAFRSVMGDAGAERDAERRERELDVQMTRVVARINMLAADAAMVLDPADAYEVMQASRLVADRLRAKPEPAVEVRQASDRNPAIALPRAS